MKLINIIILSALLVISSCKKEVEKIYKEYADVELSEIVSSDSGATYKAKIVSQGNYEIKDYGFVWAEDKSSPVLSDFKISLGSNLLNPEFSTTVQSDLVKGKKYYVRAYVQTSKYLIYSKEKIFTSGGSLAPEITSFSPLSGLDGTTITIKGKNFSLLASRNLVKIGSAEAEVISTDGNEIKIKSPVLSYGGDFKITVEVAGKKAYSENPYRIIGPRITSLSSVQVKPGDLITITGHNFLSSGLSTFVSVGGKNAIIFSSDTNKIVAVVPLIRNSGALQINVGNKTETYSINLTLMPTWLNASVPEFGVERNELFSINDKGYCLFNRKLYQYTPETNSWNHISDFPGNIYSESFKFVIGRKMYMGGGIGANGNLGVIASKEFWVYDEETNTWSRLNDIYNSSNFDKRITPWSFSINGLGYIWSYGDGHLWCYNSLTNQWTQKNDIPIGSYMIGAVVIDRVPYFISGKNLWEYNVERDQFSQKTTCPMVGSYALTGGLALQDNGFFMSASGETYKYNATLNFWFPLQYYPCGGGTAIPAFVLGNRVYFGNFGGGGLISCQYTLNYMIH